jgi:hypothetical protein
LVPGSLGSHGEVDVQLEIARRLAYIDDVITSNANRDQPLTAKRLPA